MKYIATCTVDVKSLMTTPTAMKEYSEVIKHLYNKWQHVLDDGVDIIVQRKCI